jgi:DNA-binding MarR family transcriptional regulator
MTIEELIKLSRDTELGLCSAAALYFIGQTPGLACKEISQLMGVSQAGASGLLKLLEDRKLIRRVRGSSDRRYIEARLTPEGRNALDKNKKNEQ